MKPDFQNSVVIEENFETNLAESTLGTQKLIQPEIN